MAKQPSTSRGLSATSASLPIVYKISLANEVRYFSIQYTEPQITDAEAVLYQTYQTPSNFVPPSKVILTFNKNWPNLPLHAFGFSVSKFCVSHDLRSVIELNFPNTVEFHPIAVESNSPIGLGPFYLIRVPKDIEVVDSKQVYPPFRSRDVAGVDIWRSGGGSLYCSERFRSTLFNAGVSGGWQFRRYEVVE